MRRSRVIVGGGLVAVLAVALLLFLKQPLTPSEVIHDFEAVGGAPAPVEPEAPLPAPAMQRETAKAAPAVEVEAAAAPPPSYTAHLSGLTGRVVDTDGSPMPDMKVEALAATLNDFLVEAGSVFDAVPPTFDEVKGSTRTDEEGRFRFEKLEPRGIYVLGIDLGGSRATLRFVDRAPNPGELVDLGDIALDPYVVFTGRVVDGDRDPVADARVRATNLPSVIFSFGVHDLRPGFAVAFQDDLSSDWRVAPIPTWLTRLVDRIPVPTTRTAADGTFRLEGVPLGLVTVLADKPGLVSLVHGPVPSGHGGERAVGDLMLPFGEVLEGKVTDLDDIPIAGVEVMAGAQMELAPAALLLPGGVTDAEGRFRIPGLRDVEHAVAARKPGRAQWHVVTDVVPGYDEAHIRIGATVQLHVVVRDPEGQVLEQPQIAMQKQDALPLHPLLVPPIDLSGRLHPQDDGSVIISDLDPVRYAVMARAEGYAVARVEADLREGSGAVAATLERELRLPVSVISKKDREPVHWAQVGVFPERGRREMPMPLLTRRTGPDGFVDLPGLTPGEYHLAVFHPGYAEARVEVKVPGSPVIVELLQGGTLAGRVRDGERPADPERFIGAHRTGEDNFPRFSVSSGPDGTFQITHLEPGTYEIVVMRRFAQQPLGDLVANAESLFATERFLEAEVQEGETTFVDIDLKDTGLEGPKARLLGRVELNGRPAPGLALEHRPDGNRRGRRSAITDEQGRFDFGEVMAGEGTLVVRQPGGQSGRFQFGRLATQELDLPADETRELNLDIRTGSLRGRVVDDRDGRPLAAAELNLVQQEAENEWTEGTRMETVTGSDGRFEFELVPGGTYRLRVERQGFANAAVAGIHVPDHGEPAPVEVRLTGGVSVAGIVELPPTAEPSPWLFLEFRGIDGNETRGGGRVNPETFAYEVRSLLPGPYEVRAHGPELRVEPLRVDVPAGGLQGHRLRFTPSPAGAGDGGDF